MSLTPAALFVRDVLGCACPAEVLERTAICETPTAIAGMPVDLAISVGGRLLVCVTRSNEPELIADTLAAVFRQGRELLDRGGYHRFRFVVATPASVHHRANAMLTARLPALGDERLHLHVIADHHLPTLVESSPGRRSLG